VSASDGSENALCRTSLALANGYCGRVDTHIAVRQWWPPTPAMAVNKLQIQLDSAVRHGVFEALSHGPKVLSPDQ
jgi:hypothetical protein